MEPTVQNIWNKSKSLIKAGIIAVIILLLQIPNHFVTELISERETRQKEAVAEVSAKWAGRQNVIGPVLAVPYWQSTSDTTMVRSRVKSVAYFLPDTLDIKASATPQEKHRGIFKVMLYTAQVSMTGSFSNIDPQRLNIAPQDMIWSEAFVLMNLSDSRGLNEEVALKMGDSTVRLTPSIDGSDREGLKAALPLAAQPSGTLTFSTSLSINGSEQLLFTPVGRATTVKLNSAWPHPSFSGNLLPQSSTINNDGFTASWKSVAFRQPFPQQWKGDAYSLQATADSGSVSKAAFGADLFVPVNGYQKTMRSIKYSLLCLVLTFAAFFLIEMANGRSAHPFQYGLVGLALILFYTLLLSVSEYTGFNIAYIIASICTIGLIAWFVKDVLASGKLATVLATVLVLLYAYVFTILQLQDYSLLLGSVGLFITLAVMMKFSKRFQW